MWYMNERRQNMITANRIRIFFGLVAVFSILQEIGRYNREMQQSGYGQLDEMLTDYLQDPSRDLYLRIISKKAALIMCNPPVNAYQREVLSDANRLIRRVRMAHN